MQLFSSQEGTYVHLNLEFEQRSTGGIYVNILFESHSLTLADGQQRTDVSRDIFRGQRFPAEFEKYFSRG